MQIKKIIYIGLIFASWLSCQNQTTQKEVAFPIRVKAASSKIQSEIEQPEGQTIKTRFLPPPDFERIHAPANSFAAYLQNLPLKPKGEEVKYYNGAVKPNRGVYTAVVDIDVGTRDLQQCADAIMRLRAEYLWIQKNYEDIHFNFTNGFRVDYSRWREGYRMRIEGAKTNWYKGAEANESYQSFRKYLNLIFAYAGTLSLAGELKATNLKELQIGDIFIQGGSPGHAVIIVDMAVHPETDEKVFLLAQSYMPAQDIQILQNPTNGLLNPWYSDQIENRLYTPEWTFQTKDLKRF